MVSGAEPRAVNQTTGDQVQLKQEGSFQVGVAFKLVPPSVVATFRNRGCPGNVPNRGREKKPTLMPRSFYAFRHFAAL